MSTGAYEREFVGHLIISINALLLIVKYSTLTFNLHFRWLLFCQSQPEINKILLGVLNSLGHGALVYSSNIQRICKHLAPVSATVLCIKTIDVLNFGVVPFLQ